MRGNARQQSLAKVGLENLDPALCPFCAYDLRAHLHAACGVRGALVRCPECGQESSPERLADAPLACERCSTLRFPLAVLQLIWVGAAPWRLLPCWQTVAATTVRRAVLLWITTLLWVNVAFAVYFLAQLMAELSFEASIFGSGSVLNAYMWPSFSRRLMRPQCASSLAITAMGVTASMLLMSGVMCGLLRGRWKHRHSLAAHVARRTALLAWPFLTLPVFALGVLWLRELFYYRTGTGDLLERFGPFPIVGPTYAVILVVALTYVWRRGWKALLGPVGAAIIGAAWTVHFVLEYSEFYYSSVSGFVELAAPLLFVAWAALIGYYDARRRGVLVMLFGACLALAVLALTAGAALQRISDWAP